MGHINSETKRGLFMIILWERLIQLLKVRQVTTEKRVFWKFSLLCSNLSYQHISSSLVLKVLLSARLCCPSHYRTHTHARTHTHTHTHSLLTALILGLPRWAGTRKVKPIRILLKQETVSGSGISWAVCKSAHRSRQITTPAPHHSRVFYRPDALPATQPTASKHWRQKVIREANNNLAEQAHIMHPRQWHHQQPQHGANVKRMWKTDANVTHCAIHTTTATTPV